MDQIQIIESEEIRSKQSVVEGNLRDEIKNSSPEALEVLEPDPTINDSSSFRSESLSDDGPPSRCSQLSQN